MLWLRSVLARLRGAFDREQVDNDIAAEVAAHLALKQQRLIDSGMDRDEAAREARQAFGNAGLC